MRVEITQAGPLGTMQLRWQVGAGAWTAATSLPANAFVFKVPGDLCTIVFPVGIYVAAETYTIALDGTIVKTGAGPVISTRDRGGMTAPVEVVIIAAGALGTMTFQWRHVGVGAASATQPSANTDPFIVEAPEAGFRLLFAPGNYTMPGVYTIATTGVVTVASGLAGAVTAERLCGTSCTTEEYAIEVSAGAWAPGNCDLVEPVATEVFNVVLVQKGGDDDGIGNMRELLVYKEYVSPIDFMGPYESNGWHMASGLGRVGAIHGDLTRAILPTAGSRDLLAALPNSGNEVNRSGLGGGSVFTVDGITFGLEVCLDHARNKLYDFYHGATPPPPGTPRVQIHLIPSWGMSIEEGNRCGVTGARIFNVDGPNGSAAGKLEDPTIADPEDKMRGKWLRRLDATSVPLPVLPSVGNWAIKVRDPESLGREAASLAHPQPFALIDRQLPAPAGGMATFFERKTTGFGDLKVYPANKPIPDAETT
jgi:hypothetical protein